MAREPHSYYLDQPTSDVMIEWKDTFDDQVRAMSDEEIIRAYRATSQQAGDPIVDAYRAEIERRGLDF